MFAYVNAGLQAMRAGGASGRLDEERKRLAAEYRRLGPAARRQKIQEFREAQAEAKRVAQEALEVVAAGDGSKHYSTACVSERVT